MYDTHVSIYLLWYVCAYVGTLTNTGYKIFPYHFFFFLFFSRARACTIHMRISAVFWFDLIRLTQILCLVVVVQGGGVKKTVDSNLLLYSLVYCMYREEDKSMFCTHRFLCCLREAWYKLQGGQKKGPFWVYFTYHQREIARAYERQVIIV